MEVIVYSSPACVYCVQLKDWLKERNIEFKEIDLSQSQEAIDDFVKKTGQMAVPAIEINGEMIVGFDVVKIKAKLNI